MDLLSLVSENLYIPRHQCNLLSQDRVACIVSQDWWKQCCLGKVKLPQALDVVPQTQAEQWLAGTCLTIPEQWKKITVKIVQKTTQKVQCLRDGPLYPTDCAGSLVEFMATTSQENFRNVWHAAYRKYKKDHTSTDLLPGEEFSVVFKKYMWRMLPDVYINLDDVASSSVLSESKKGDSNGWHNIVPVKAFVESSSHYFIIQPCLSYALSDLVSFSPAILNSSNAHTMFLLYQILQAMKIFHENGLSIGNITMHNILLDKNLWVYVSVPVLQTALMDECSSASSEQKHIQNPDPTQNKETKQKAKSEKPKNNISLTTSLIEPHTSQHSTTQGLDYDSKKEFAKKNHLFLSRVLRSDSRAHDSFSEGEQCLRNAQEFISKCQYQQFEVYDLPSIVKNWIDRKISNFKYLMILNHLAGRKMGDPNNHPVLPWIMDFTLSDGNYRDLTMSKFRLNKGDGQLDLTYSTMSLLSDDGTDVPHHVSDVLSDITYYVYKARRTPKLVLCSHVRTNWVPHEYPSSIVRLQEWTPDECIPEFYIDPNIFVSIHDDLPDLELPGWCSSSQEFIIRHLSVLESEKISESLHHWIDLTFGYKLTGAAAVKSKNVYLQLVDQHKTVTGHGVVQLFSQPHPHRLPLTSFSHPHPPKVTREILNSQLLGIGISMEESEAKSAELSFLGSFEPLDQTRPETAVIHLPKNFHPIAELEHYEAEYNFLTRSMLVPIQEQSKQPKTSVPEHTCTVTEDVLQFACLMCEMFLAPKLMMQDTTPCLASRYDKIKKLSSTDFMELPRPLQKVASFLIHEVDKQVSGRGKTIFSYEPVTQLGLPPPSPTQLLQSYSGILPFPGYFSDLYTCICQLKGKDSELEHIQHSNKSLTEKTNLIKQTERQKVPLIERFLVRYQGKLGSEGLHLLLPYIEDLYSKENTTVQAAWSLFGIISRELGFKETSSKFMPYLIKLFAGENSTAKHARLYSRSFLLQLIIRLGLETFLLNFSTLLVEAVSGYKDFSLPSKYYQEELLEEIQGETELTEQTAFWSKDANGYTDHPEIWTKPAQDDLSQEQVTTDEPGNPDEELTENNSWDTAQEDNTDNTAADVDDIEEEFPDNILLSDDRDNTQDNLLASGDAHSIGQVSSEESGDRQSFQDDSDTEPMVTASDRVSIHSISNIIGNTRLRSVSAGESDTASLGDISAEYSVFDDSSPNPDTATLSGNFDQDGFKLFRPDSVNETGSNHMSLSNSSPVSSKCPDLSDKTDLTVDVSSNHMVRSETDDLIMLNLSSSSPADVINIHDIASESVKWLCCKLGPVLTAKYFSKNLIRMLALCYFGHEQLQIIQNTDDDCLKSSKLVVGDRNAQKILECLGHVALLYGEQVILLQYIQCIIDMVSVSQRRLTQRSESGLFGALILLKYIIPYISDKALLDCIEDTIVENCLMAVIKLVTNTSVSFPGGSYVRSVVCHKVVDALYVIGLRLGFEMTRIHLNQCMQKLLEVFSYVHGHLTDADQCPEMGTSASPGADGVGSSEESYLTIKMDPNSQEYKIGTPIYVSGLSLEACSPLRKSQSSSKFHSLTSLGAVDDREDSQELKVGPKENGMQEVSSVFTAELAQAIYIPLCRIFGSIHMEHNLRNDDLIRQLCAQQDQSVDQQMEKKRESDSTTVTSLESPRSPTEEKVTGAIGRNVEVIGNRIQLTPESRINSPEMHRFGCGYRHSGILSINPDDLKCCDKEYTKHRHLKGNWLAYWEHELGLHERDTLFNFKQIKLQTFVGHNSSIRSLCVMDNESSFISASKDKTVKLWSVTSSGDGSSRVSFQWNYTQHKKSVFSVAFVDSLRLVASCDSTVHIWDPFTGEPVNQLESIKYAPVVALTALPAPSTLVVTATTEATLRFLDTRISKYAHEFKCTVAPAGLIRCVTVSPDGGWVAVGFATGVISILEVNSGLLMSTWKAHEGEILQIKAYNKTKLVSSSFDQTMKLWNAEDASLICVLKGPTEPVHCVCFYRNQVLSATTGNKIGLHTSVDEMASFSSTKLRTDTFKGVLTSMVLLPLNRSLLLGADNGSIRLLC
ncbi:WD repeat-containing protein 81-like [Gigantopelta aegis]|uniref:WD repeat-containing protein 81-like n=1 Tax=Gigantopelta aegis TaxID=1735272 RepID=UPI001B88B71D|nr:WD repeat-containing protein 81-like [Gigantopelta aegis]